MVPIYVFQAVGSLSIVHAQVCCGGQGGSVKAKAKDCDQHAQEQTIAHETRYIRSPTIIRFV